MASLRFALTNLIESASTILKNGTGGGAPVRSETSPWLMENAMNRGRGLVWMQASGAAMDVDFDLTGAASNVSVGVLALLGHRGAPSGAVGITACTPRYSTHANGYPPSAASAWTDFPAGGMVLGAAIRDDGAVVTPVSCRYLRYSLTVSTVFTLGRFFAGGVDVDLGVKYSFGRVRVRMDPEHRMQDGGSNPTITYTGDPRFSLSLPYDSADATLFALLQQIGHHRGSKVLIESDGTFFEVVKRDGTFRDVHNFDLPDDFDSSLELETLG